MAEKAFTSCTNSGPVSVYVDDGKIVRVRPLVVEEKDFKPWVIEAGGNRYSPPKKVTLSPYVHAERRRIYSDERLKYPMKRVDFDPNGERNPQNRGRSRYERISWDEAATLVASELTRVRDTYGSSAISGITSSHHNWGIVGYKMGPFGRFLNLVQGTPVLDNPDSWEGWHWGATHSYGFYWRLGMPEPYDMLTDALQNAEMIVYWSNDPDSTRGTYSGQDSALWRQWLKEKGVKMVFIDPFYNYTNARQMAVTAPRNRRRFGLGHRFRLDNRGHLQQGLRRQSHHRLRRVQEVRTGRDRRRTQDARVGGRRIGRRGSSHPHSRPGMGGQAHHPIRRLARW